MTGSGDSMDEEAYRSCIRNIMLVHRLAILSCGEDRERGLEDAVINPTAIGGLCDRIERCPDCFSKAAAAIDYVVSFHPFADGNKRTAFLLAVAILKDGGYRLDDNEDTFRLMKDAAWGKMSGDAIEDWLRSNSRVGSS